MTENAAVLNTTNAEVGTRFDSRRVSELPLATNRNIYNIALSAAGVSQLQSNQAGFTQGVNYSSNGGRLRSNNFQLDGQDNNDFGVAGAAIGLNNPDLIQEVRLVTNQYTAEFGRNSSSVFNAITKSGTNEYHGSGFWFHNDNALNSCTNLNKAAGFCRPSGSTLGPNQSYKRPFRVENQLGGTIGGPLHLPRFGEGGPSYISGKDRTFFFFSIQRWWDRQLGQGVSVNGIPTAEGRAILQQQAGNRPHVAALLQFLPLPQAPNGTTADFTVGGNTFNIPLGRLTGSSSFVFDDWQSSFRVDHRFNNDHTLNARYIYQDGNTTGAGQSTPPGYESANVQRSQGLNFSLTSVLSPNLVNEARAAFLRRASATVAADLSAEAIPSIQITALGLQGLNAGATRTAIGLAANLPQNSVQNTYQLQDNLSYTTGNHALKFGADIRRQQLHQLFKPTARGHLVYSNLNNFVNDLGNVQINRDLPGVARVLHLDWHDFFFYGQDEWKIRPNFTLTYGLRYENAGQPIQDLVQFNDPVFAASGNNPVFRVRPDPGPRPEQPSAAHRLQLEPAHPRGRPARLAHGRRQARAARRLRAHARLRLHQHRAQHLEQLPVRRRLQPDQRAGRLRQPPDAPDQPARLHPHAGHRGLRVADLRLVQPRNAARDVARRGGARRLRRLEGQRAVREHRRQPAPDRLRPARGLPRRVQRRPDGRHHPPARQLRQLDLPLVAGEHGEASFARLLGGPPLHVEHVHRHDVGDLQQLRRRDRAGAGAVQPPRSTAVARPTTARSGSPATSSTSCRGTGTSAGSSATSSAAGRPTPSSTSSRARPSRRSTARTRPARSAASPRPSASPPARTSTATSRSRR